MPLIKMHGVEMDVDIRGELEQYVWTKPRWSETKLIAASPFRYDNTPSFMVNLEGEYAGTFVDSGAYDADYESGNLAKLLAFLRDETYEETVEYLTGLYGVGNSGQLEKIRINPVRIASNPGKVVIDNSELSEYMFRHAYLSKRGISEKVQRFMGVGYSKQDKAVVMPWRHADGTLANYKYRKIYGKSFWYRKGGAAIRTLVYGIDKIYRHNLREAYVCEAEIDAMSWMTAGKPAIAIGGTSVTRMQLDLIRKSPIERIVIAEDNDKAGGKLGNALREGLRGYVEVLQVKLPPEYKDANEALVAGEMIGDIEPGLAIA